MAASLLLVAAGGCAAWPLRRSTPEAAALERADSLARQGSWEEAVSAYGEYLRLYPDADSAPRAAASRDTLRALLSARAELARMKDELVHLRDDLARRDGDLVRVRQEADRLKTDLERLKQIDLKLERRK